MTGEPMEQRTISSIFILTLLVFTNFSSHAQLEEIVVTGSRISASFEDQVPVVFLKKRADFMVTKAYVESDSRSDKLRRNEVLKTIDALQKSASRNPDIELGLLKTFETDDDEIEYIVPFSMDEIEKEGLNSGYRADTTRVNLIIKTPIKSADSDPEKVYARLDSFMDSVTVSGRTVVTDSSDPGLSIVNIAQYRRALLEKIAQDTRLIQEVFGDNYRINISGLESPVRWRMIEALELAIYFPYYSSAQSSD